jgi:hypothetical protein
VHSRTTAAMTHSDSSSLVVRGARVAVWVVVPIVAVVLLRLFPPLELASNGELVAWLGPASAALVALCAAASTLLALVRGFRRDGLAGDLFAAAGLGALAAGAAAVALGGPDAAAVFPTAILPIAVVAAGLALLAAEVVPPVAVSGRLARLAAAALIFAWIEVPPAIGLLVKALTDLASPIAGAGAALLGIAAVTAAIGAPETRRLARCHGSQRAGAFRGPDRQRRPAGSDAGPGDCRRGRRKAPCPPRVGRRVGRLATGCPA